MTRMGAGLTGTGTVVDEDRDRCRRTSIKSNFTCKNTELQFVTDMQMGINEDINLSDKGVVHVGSRVTLTSNLWGQCKQIARLTGCTKT